MNENGKLDLSSKYLMYYNHIRKEDKVKFLECISKINLLFENSKPIPTKLAREYFGYFINKEEEDLIDFEEKLLKVSNVVIEHFTKDPGYKFQAKKGGLTFKFEECIKTLLYGYKLNVLPSNKGLIDLSQRNLLINYFYDALSRYSEPFNTKRTLLISKYKKIVIAAYITQALGYKFTTKKEVSNKELYDASKHYI